MVISFVVLFGVSYAFVGMTLTGTKNQAITVGSLELELIEDENNLTIMNALPMYDEVGMMQEPFTFRLKNKSTITVNYKIKLVDITVGNSLNTNDVKYGFTKDGINAIKLLSSLAAGVIDEGYIEADATIEYELRLWIRDDLKDNDAINNKSLSYKIDVEAKQIEGTLKEIVFNVDGNTDMLSHKEVIVGDVYGELPIASKDGYALEGWYIEETKITEDSIVTLEDETLTAKWVPNKYKVTFDVNGGTINLEEMEVTYGTSYGELPIPTKSDCTFLGWYTALTGGEKVESTTEVNILENQMLYAHWKKPVTTTKKGDYVAYVGNNGCSGSYCQGANNSCAAGSYSGWRVAYIESNRAYLVSAGSTDCVNINPDSLSSGREKFVPNLDAVTKKYCNQNFVDGDCSNNNDVWAFKNTDFQKITGSTVRGCKTSGSTAACGKGNNLIDNGGKYWFSAPTFTGNRDQCANYWWKSRVYETNSTTNNGVRPVIRLSTSVYVTGGSGTMNDPWKIAND